MDAPDDPSHDVTTSIKDYLNTMGNIDEQIVAAKDEVYRDYRLHLKAQCSDCDQLLTQIGSVLDTCKSLTNEYELVAINTSTLHSESEKLIRDQEQLNQLHADVSDRLKHFKRIDHLLQKLDSPTLSVSGDNFWAYMDQIDDGLEFLSAYKQMKDTQQYIIKYRQCLSRGNAMIKSYVGNVLTTASDQVMKHSTNKVLPSTSTDAAFALFYGRFKAFAAKIKYVTAALQRRREKNKEYTRLIETLEELYLDHRAKLISEGVTESLKDLALQNKNDHCAMTRLSCAFIVNICLDEYHLFYEFFHSHDHLLTGFMDGLCGILYDRLRPSIIHINHLETLAEICIILKVEMLEEHVHLNRK